MMRFLHNLPHTAALPHILPCHIIIVISVTQFIKAVLAAAVVPFVTDDGEDDAV